MPRDVPYVTSCHAMSRHAMSCNVTSCHILPRHVTSRHVTSCYIISLRKSRDGHTTNASLSTDFFHTQSIQIKHDRVRWLSRRLPIPYRISGIWSSFICWRQDIIQQWNRGSYINFFYFYYNLMPSTFINWIFVSLTKFISLYLHLNSWPSSTIIGAESDCQHISTDTHWNLSNLKYIKTHCYNWRGRNGWWWDGCAGCRWRIWKNSVELWQFVVFWGLEHGWRGEAW